MNDSKKLFVRLCAAALAAPLLLAGCSGDGASGGDAHPAGEDSAAEDIVTNEQYAVLDEELPLLADLLPGVIAQLSSGGRVPEEYRPAESTPACIDPISLKGTWCVEGSTTETPLASTDSTVPAEFPSSDPAIEEFTCLPDTLVFGLGDNGYPVDSLGGLSVNAGYYLADLTYRNQDGTPFYSILPYAVNGTTLAVGFYDSQEEDSAAKVQEMDYLISWNGWKLTLSYGEESVTYVPYVTVRDAETGHVHHGGEIVAGYDGIDGITGIYPDAEEPQIVYGEGEPLEASYEFREDGTVTIQVEDGRSYEFTFRYSGDTLTLIDGNHVALYAM